MADRIASSLVDSFTVNGESVETNVTANISVVSLDNPLKKTDHAIWMVDPGKISTGARLQRVPESCYII